MENKISFKNNNLKMSGLLYTPNNFDNNKKYPTLICVHPGGGVKEQTASLYARKMAEHGFITIAFDASHQGESEGEPRFLEDPTTRVEDIRSAVDYLVTLPYVDHERIGVIGICAGSGYAISAAQTERRIKAVGGVSGVDIGILFREGLGGGVSVSEQLKTLENVSAQRTAEANGAEPMYIPYVPNSPENFDESTSVLMREAYDYYRTPRGQHPNSTNKMLFTSIDKISAYSAYSQIDNYLTQPLLMIAGSDADTRYFSEKAIELSNSNKELFLVEGATHISMYDEPKHVDQAINKFVNFFTENI